MQTNKEVIDALTKYYVTQDRETVARCLASVVVDYNRMFNYKVLSPKEKACFNARVIGNVMSLRKFIKDGPDGDLVLHKWNSEE